MAIDSCSILVGRCFVTPDDDVRKVLELDRDSVTYVVRGKLAFPSWDTTAWKFTSKDVFASEVVSEVLSDWRAAGAKGF